MMKLTRTERWILSNQYRIMEAVIPSEAEDFKSAREAIESGYELQYDSNIQHIIDDEYVMSEEECIEVLDILSMFDALQNSFKNLADKSGINEHLTRFVGFDGNNEFRQLGYAKYFCKLDGGRFADLKIANSHAPTLWRYRPMVAIWKSMGENYELSKADIMALTDEKIGKP